MLACSVKWTAAMRRRSSRDGDPRGRFARIAITALLAVLILASWLSFDWLLAIPRTTEVVAQPPRSDGEIDQEGHTPGQPGGAGSSGVAGGGSGITRGDGVAGSRDPDGPSSGGPGSYSSSAGTHPGTGSDSVGSSDGTGGESGGSAPGWTTVGSPGSGTGPNGSSGPVVAGLPPNAGTPPGGGPGIGSGPGAPSDGNHPLSVVSDGGGAEPPGGPVPPPISTGGSGSLPNGQSGPPGSTSGPVTDDAPWGPEGDPHPDATVPVPAGLLLFGTAAALLAVASRMRRGSPRSRDESPLTH